MSIAFSSLEPVARCYQMLGMKEVEEIRRRNLERLVAERGGQRSLADAIGKAPAQISQWINRSPYAKSGKPRVMGSRAARSIEAALGLPSGSLDHLEQAPTRNAASRRLDPGTILEVLDFLEGSFRALGREFSLRTDAALFADAYAYFAEDDRPEDRRNLVDFDEWRRARQQGGPGVQHDQPSRSADPKGDREGGANADGD
jgi:hypothetical protein